MARKKDVEADLDPELLVLGANLGGHPPHVEGHHAHRDHGLEWGKLTKTSSVVNFEISHLEEEEVGGKDGGGEEDDAQEGGGQARPPSLLSLPPPCSWWCTRWSRSTRRSPA